MSTTKVFPATGGSADFTTGVVYVGPMPQQFIVEDTFKMPVDEFGVARLTRDYVMRRDAPILPQLPKKGVSFDFQFPSLRCFDYELTARGVFYYLKIQFNGFAEKPKAPLTRDRKTSQIRNQVVYSRVATDLSDATSGRIGTVGGLNFRYISRGLIRRYSLPQPQKFQDEYEDKSAPLSPVKVIGIFTENGIQLDLRDFNEVIRLFDIRNQQKNVRVDFDEDHEGEVYNCTEVIERQIIQEQVFAVGGFNA